MHESETKTPRQRRHSGLTAQERALARRDDFLLAGIALLGTRGIEATRIKDVCDEARLSTRQFYETFTNFEDFALAVARRATLDLALGATLAMMNVEDPGDRTMAAILDVVEALAEDPRPGRIVFVECARAGGALSDWRDQTLTSIAELAPVFVDVTSDVERRKSLESWMQALVNADSTAPPRAGPADPFALLALGALSALVEAWLEERVRLSPAEVVASVVDVTRSAIESRREAARLARGSAPR